MFVASVSAPPKKNVQKWIVRQVFASGKSTRRLESGNGGKVSQHKT